MMYPSWYSSIILSLFSLCVCVVVSLARQKKKKKKFFVSSSNTNNDTTNQQRQEATTQTTQTTQTTSRTRTPTQTKRATRTTSTRTTNNTSIKRATTTHSLGHILLVTEEEGCRRAAFQWLGSKGVGRVRWSESACQRVSSRTMSRQTTKTRSARSSS